METSNADHIKIPGVDTSDIDVENIEIPGVDVDIQEPQVIEIIDTDIPPTDPDPREPATVHQADAAVEPMPAIQQVDPKLLRSSRIRTQTENYNPSMSVSKYAYAVTEPEIQGVLNPDAHMFVQEKLCQAEPDFMESVMTQLFLKSGLRAWGDHSLVKVVSLLTPRSQALLGKIPPAQTYVHLGSVILGFPAALRHRGI